jgi:hypothetical protein
MKAAALGAVAFFIETRFKLMEKLEAGLKLP